MSGTRLVRPVSSSAQPPATASSSKFGRSTSTNSSRKLAAPSQRKASTLTIWTTNGNGSDPAEYFRWGDHAPVAEARSEEHTSELQSLMRISYAVFCLKKKHKN